jgi:hypothetical protein
MTEEVKALTCMRVADIPVPPVPSRRARCKICGSQVWVSLRAPAIPLIHCVPCTMDEVGEARAEIALHKEVLDEVRDYFAKKEH